MAPADHQRPLRRAPGRRHAQDHPRRGEPIYLVVIDEYAYFSATVGTKTQQAEFSALTRDLVARGRAAGSSSSWPPSGPPTRSSTPASATCSATGGPSAAPPTPAPTPSWATAGPGKATPPPASTPSPAASPGSSPKPASPAGSSPRTSPTPTSPTWRPTPPAPQKGPGMSPANAPGRPRGQHQHTADGTNTVNSPLTSNRGGRWWRTTTTPRSPTASCGPTRAASLPATSRPWAG